MGKKKKTHGELEKLVGAESGEEEATDVTIEVLARDLLGVSVAVGSHENVELLP